jgi:hypothetical protein
MLGLGYVCLLRGQRRLDRVGRGEWVGCRSLARSAPVVALMSSALRAVVAGPQLAMVRNVRLLLLVSLEGCRMNSRETDGARLLCSCVRDAADSGSNSGFNRDRSAVAESDGRETVGDSDSRAASFYGGFEDRVVGRGKHSIGGR